MAPRYKDVESRYLDEREAVFRALGKLDRRSFLKVAGAAAGIVAAKGLVPPHSFSLVRVAGAQPPAPPRGATPRGAQVQGPVEPFRFAYISDSHLYERDVNDRFVNQLLRAVDDVNALDPQPDFVLYGGDLAQLGKRAELELGAQILRGLRAPVRMMVGEHDWFLDMGEAWLDLFGEQTYSFDHKGVHFVVLNSILQRDFWTPLGMTPMERMLTVAGLDNQRQSRFEVGEAQRAWLEQDLAGKSATTPIIVFSHSPLYKLYRPWNFWTDDAEQVQATLSRFRSVVVIHGHTHQILTNRIGNIHFHGMLSTAWPWPYAPEGTPELTVEMNRPNPFNPADGCGNGELRVHPDGLVDKIYGLWNRRPITVSRAYTTSSGAQDRPPRPNLPTF